MMTTQKHSNPSVSCVALQAITGLPTVDLAKFAGLDDDGRELINEWFSTARSKSVDNGREPFDRFIFAWIAFNGWACCVTKLEKDAKWRDALASDRRLHEFFAAAVHNDQRLSDAVAAFIALWPIFKTIELKNKNLSDYGGTNRRELVEKYLRGGAEVYEPSCWTIHCDISDPALADWPHTLYALYRVRCNLFHGEKGYTSQSDRTIVRAASCVLLRFLELANLFGDNPMQQPPDWSHDAPR